MGIYVIPALFYIAAVLMPGRRTLAIYGVAAGAALLTLYIWYSSAHSDLGPGGFIAIAVYYFSVIAFVCGVGVRSLSLLLASYGHKILAVAICIVGAASPYGVVAGFLALEKWEKLPAPAACIEAGIPIELGKSRFNIPAPLFVVRERGTARDLLHTRVPSQMRALCSRTGNGAKPLRAAHLALHYRLHIIREECRAKATKRIEPLCAALPHDAKTLEETNLPIRLSIYVPEELDAKDFSGLLRETRFRNITNAPSSEGEIYVTSGVLAPDNKPLRFRCQSRTDRRYPCSAVYALEDGTFVHYEFQSPPDEIAERGRRTDAIVQALIAALREPAVR